MNLITKKLLNILIQLAQADKHFAKSERELIYSLANERGISEESVNELIKNPEPIDPMGTLTQEQKFDYLFSTIELIFADRNIFESEKVFCKAIAMKLGFRKDVIDYFIEQHGKSSREALKAVALNRFV
jgi:uncharacterized tellurite resistance protein B-like protein